MHMPAVCTRLRRELPGWLLGIDGLILLLVFGFMAAYAVAATPPFGPVVAVAVALCFPSALLLGVVNGLALQPKRSDDVQPRR